ncbi:MAG: hypothetical protein ACXVB0_20845 [Mucilaginibacter sp.]
MITSVDIKHDAVFTISAQELYSKDMLRVKKGEKYQFRCEGDQKWKDWFISTTADGYFNLFAWIFGMRVKRSKCFCLCGVFNQDDSTAFSIGSNNTIVIEKTGLISFFANDAKGFYKNNSGRIDLTITRLPHEQPKQSAVLLPLGSDT